MPSELVRLTSDTETPADESWCDRCGLFRPVDDLERTEVPAPPNVLAKAADGALRLLLCSKCRTQIRKGDR